MARRSKNAHTRAGYDKANAKEEGGSRRGGDAHTHTNAAPGLGEGCLLAFTSQCPPQHCTPLRGRTLRSRDTSSSSLRRAPPHKHCKIHSWSHELTVHRPCRRWLGWSTGYPASSPSGLLGLVLILRWKHERGLKSAQGPLCADLPTWLSWWRRS